MMVVVAYVLAGWLIGVLLNRAADNLPPPNRRSLLQAPLCPYCGQSKAAIEQSGLLAMLVARGRCSHCGARQRWRPVILEVASTFLFALIGASLGATLLGILYALITAFLLLITVIDLEHRLILSIVIFPSTLIALVCGPLIQWVRAGTAVANPLGLVANTLLGALVGYLVVFGIYLFGGVFARFERARGRRISTVPFGLGDVELAGMIGALVGLSSIGPVLVYSIFLGGLGSIAVLLFQAVVRRRNAALSAIPYGPFFTIATWGYLAAALGVVARLIP